MYGAALSSMPVWFKISSSNRGGSLLSFSDINPDKFCDVKRCSPERLRCYHLRSDCPNDWMGHITLHLRPTLRINLESTALSVSPSLELPMILTFSRFSSSFSTSMRRSSDSSVMFIAEEFPKPTEEPCPVPRAPTERVRRLRSITTTKSRSKVPMLREVSEIFSSGGMMYGPIGRRRTSVKEISKRFRFGQRAKKGCTDASDKASCLNFRLCRFLKAISGVLEKVFNNFENALSVCKWTISIQLTIVKAYIAHPAGDASHFQDFQARAQREHCAKG